MNNQILKSSIKFILQSTIFTIIFWSLWLFVIRPAFYPSNKDSANSPDAENNVLMEKYRAQVERADQQQKQAQDTLDKQNELLVRWEKVIQHWEKQTQPMKK